MQSRRAGLLALCLFASNAWAARPFHVEDMQKLARVGGPRISPDGTTVAFTVTRSDVARNKSVTNVWVVAATRGEPRPMTFSDTG